MAAAKFMESPTLEQLETFKKLDLLQIAGAFGIEVKTTMRKLELKQLIVEYLVDDDKLPEDSLSRYPSPMDSTALEIKRIEAEVRMKEIASKEKEIEMHMMQGELKRMEIEMGERELLLREKELKAKANNFDMSRHVKLVPPFNENEVDKYFQHFEKVAESLKWPRTMWSL